MFQGCGDNKGFIRVWEEQVHPHLNTASGIFSPPCTSSSMPTHMDDVNLSPTTNQKRKSTSVTPPCLMPATKTARLQQEQTTLQEESVSEKEMDDEIAQHFVGMPAWAVFLIF